MNSMHRDTLRFTDRQTHPYLSKDHLTSTPTPTAAMFKNTRLHRTVAPILLMLGLLVPMVAHAADVFVNGVKVDGMTNQDFSDAKVRFDEKGDVHITVPGIKIHFEDDAPPPAAAQRKAPPLDKTYWLISNQTNPGSTQYIIDVHINGTFVTRATSKSTKPLTLNITKHLVKGENTVVFSAVKNLQGDRKSFDPSDTLSVLIGEGQAQGQQITIERTLTRYRRNASQLDNDTKVATIVAE